MAEYIKRDVVMKEIMAAKWMDGYDGAMAMAIAASASAADVAPVRHGRLGVEVCMNFFKERNCPVCKKRIESNFWNFCPNCGAKMDGGVDDG